MQVIYKSCECGMTLPHEFSCYAPFKIEGKKIIGSFEISEGIKAYNPLVPLPRDVRYAPDVEKQSIAYSYKCPSGDDDCPPTDVNGQLIVHKVSGRVLKIKGKKMLHFVIRLSIPYCNVNECGYKSDRSMEAWSDEFLASFQNGYRTGRGDKALFDYEVSFYPGPEMMRFFLKHGFFTSEGFE